MLDRSSSLSPQLDALIANGNTAEARPAGVYLEEVPAGTVIEIQTGHNIYRVVNQGNGNALISGHPLYCPKPTQVQIHGSVDEGGHLKWQFIGKGMKLLFLPQEHGIISTSRIQEIRTLKPGQPSSN